MKQERCVLPVKCRECGGVFDLWYDLQAQEQLRKMSFGRATVFLNKRVSRMLDQQAYCWDCRRNAVVEMSDEEDDEVEADIELAGYDLGNEFE